MFKTNNILCHIFKELCIYDQHDPGFHLIANMTFFMDKYCECSVLSVVTTSGLIGVADTVVNPLPLSTNRSLYYNLGVVTVWNVATQHYHFWLSLKDNTEDELALVESPSGLGALDDLCIKIENHLTECCQEKRWSSWIPSALLALEPHLLIPFSVAQTHASWSGLAMLLHVEKTQWQALGPRLYCGRPGYFASSLPAKVQSVPGSGNAKPKHDRRLSARLALFPLYLAAHINTHPLVP